ncbi:MAG: methyltransferase domain-containing protein [Fulvivirga sp.]
MPYSDVYGQVLLDYYLDCFEPPLLLHNDYGEPEEMPVAVFFRNEEELSELEQYALQLCHGRVLDIGAGAGVHSLILQDTVERVVAIESSPGACHVMISRGVKEVVNENVFVYQPAEKFDCLLMLMNGTGIAGTISNFRKSLQKLNQLLTKDGWIIIDSSDISYLYNEGIIATHYIGAVTYQYEYKGQRSDWFPWLYLDQEMLKKLSKEAGFEAQIVFEGDQDDYLAVLKRK